MQKCIPIVLSFFFLHTSSIGQTKAPKGFKVNTGLSMVIPASNLQFSSVGGGLDVQVQYGFSNSMLATVDVGYYGLPGEGFYPYTAVVPITVGLRYYPHAKIYAAGKIGLGVYTLSTTKINYTAYSLGAAYVLSKKWDTAIYYDGFINDKTSFGFFALRLGFTF